MKRVALVAALAISGLAARADAQSAKARSDATAAYQEGQRRYLAEDYVAAAAQFEAAYKLDPDPAYLFNIAQAYRLAKDCPRALAFYKQFLAEAPKAPNAESVKKYIRELEAHCPSRAAHDTTKSSGSPASSSGSPASSSGSPTSSSGSPTSADAASTSGPTDERRLDESMPEQPPDASRKGHVVNRIGVGALGLGLVGVTMGVVFTFKVRSDANEREDLCPSLPCDWNDGKTAREQELLELGHRDEKWMVASYIVGGAALAAGVTMMVLTSGPRPVRASSLGIVPTQGGAFVSWSLRR